MRTLSEAQIGVVEARLVNGTSVQRDGTRRQERLDADVDCPALDRVSSPMQFLFEDEHVNASGCQAWNGSRTSERRSTRTMSS